jgi:hypothetical protein
VRITFAPAKRAKTLADRGLDFADAALVFAGVTLEIEDILREGAPARTRFIRLLQAGGSDYPYDLYKTGRCRYGDPRALPGIGGTHESTHG